MANNCADDWKETYLDGSPEAESKLIDKWSKWIHEIQFNLRDRNKVAIIQRAFHAKMLAGVSNAKFRIVEKLPAHLQVGFFVPGAVYPAVVRLSNANGGIRPDTRGDFRGIAIRVTTGDEKVTDYLATNGAVSHARDARQFMLFARAAAGSRLLLLPRLWFGLGPFELLRMVNTLRKGTSRQVNSLATEQFWSRGPYKWGKCAVRFTIEPAAGTTADTPTYRAPNFLRADFVKRLKEGPVTYDFKVQLYTDQAATPIEDNSRVWKSEFIKVAELVIPQQDLTTAANRASEAVIDEVEFNPWNTTDDFRPLSSINRARKRVYQGSAHFRAGRQAFFKRGTLASLVVFLLECIWRPLNRLGVYWHWLPPLVGTTNLDVLREDLRQKNLHDTEIREKVPKPIPKITKTPPEVLGARRSDGKYNDLSDPEMGAANTRFGRNMPWNRDSQKALLDPHPREISRKLLRREEFIPATTLNVLAAAWINFMVHGWIDHIRAKPDAGNNMDVPLPDGDDWYENPMRLPRTVVDAPPAEILAKRHEILKGKDDYTNLDLLAYKNRISHWWDGSQLYGNTPERTLLVRAGAAGKDPLPDGKLAIGDDGLLPIDPTVKTFPIDLTGFNNNWWLGLSLLHTIFVKEHNAIAERLKAAYPTWSGDRLFETTRLINAALIAKIHTVEWTPAIIAHPALRISMDANWWGAVGKSLQDLYPRQSDSEALDGILGSPTNHHAAPFAFTEEFATVYRLHPLVPDDYVFLSHLSNETIVEKPFFDVQARGVRELCEDKTLCMSDLFYSLGVANPGAVTLHNYPKHLTDFDSTEGRKDMATADILRERERGLPRYNDFREYLRMPRINSFEEMTANPESARRLKEVYGHVDKVDTMVGMFAETPPAGFGFSDTAFRIFIVMASRRLKSDRFFTTDWRPEVYTQLGLDWVRDNDMKTVILRHFPELGPALQRTSNTFAPWNRVGTQGGLKTRLITDTVNMNDRPQTWYNRAARSIANLARRTS